VTKAQPSKSDQIRKLLHLPNAVIAERTGFNLGTISWVRNHTSVSGNPIVRPHDRNRDAKKVARHHNDPEYRERHKAHMREVMRRRRSEVRAS
jgi:hypothetical protein